jgi:hypothetical protein
MTDVKLSTTKQKIITYISENPNSKAINIMRHLEISKQANHIHLNELVKIGIISKTGTPPIVFYNIASEEKNTHEFKKNSINTTLEYNHIFNDYSYINPTGIEYQGYLGFCNWCNDRKFEIPKYAQKYEELTKVYSLYFSNNFIPGIRLIDASNKTKNTFKEYCFIDNIFYSSFSFMEIFGKTPLYAKLLIAKQSNSASNLKELFSKIVNDILELIKVYNIDQVGFIPPTVNRKIQLMDEFEYYLNLKLPKVKIIKIKTKYMIAQKTLSNTEDRIKNAKDTFIVESGFFGKNILLIDDFIGSGSTLNFTAEKIKKLSPKSKIIAYAIAGTPNGIINNSKKFEVVNEA